MYKMFFLILFVGYLVSCKKQPVKQNSVLDKKQLIGTWHLDSFNHGDGNMYAFSDFTKQVEFKETTETWTVNNFGTKYSSTHTYEVINDSLYITYANDITVENRFYKTGNVLIIKDKDNTYPKEWFSKK
jgi:hypothetical protein